MLKKFNSAAFIPFLTPFYANFVNSFNALNETGLITKSSIKYAG